jgi:hypothetical protein
MACGQKTLVKDYQKLPYTGKEFNCAWSKKSLETQYLRRHFGKSKNLW